VSDRIFLNNCSIGIYPDIVERREALRKLGRRKWIALLLATREVLQRGDEVLIRLASGAQMISAQTPFLFVGNNEYLSRILWEKGIGNALRLWDGWAHDWPWWRQMVTRYVGGAD
jgi:diacylglycerol kinase family enzyme